MNVIRSLGIFILFIFIIENVSSVSYTIKKSEFPDDIIFEDIKLHSKSKLIKEYMTIDIPKEIAKQFSQENMNNKKYKITVDLQNLSGGLLGNLSNLLKKLASSVVKSYTPFLILENGTSYKFNKIFPGIKFFFENIPDAEIRYQHTGIQSPIAAATQLNSLAHIQEILDQPPDYSSGLFQKINDNLKRLTISESNSKKSISPRFLEISSDGNNFSKNTESPEKMLQIIVNCEELDQQIKIIKQKWKGLNMPEWPPLGLKIFSQFESINASKLNVYLKEKLIKDIVALEISGLLNDDLQKTIDFCELNPSIRCIILKNSNCFPQDFLNFTSITNTNDDESNTLLKVDRINFIDVTTAFSSNGTANDLEKVFTHQGQASYFKYFIYFPASLQNNNVFQNLNKEAQEHHKRFWVFLEYLDLLKEGNSI